jgi:PqqD family protein of HPr-rel-A system
MNDEDRPARHPSIETAMFEAEAEAVLYDERTGTVHHLNPSACAIWMLLDGRTVRDLVDTLSQATGVPQTDIRRDVLRTIGMLRDAGLLAS